MRASIEIGRRSAGRLRPAARVLAAGLAGLVALSTASCSFGPRILPTASADYGHAIHQSANEQLLTHLVQLRNRESLTLLDTNQIVSQYQVEGVGSIGGTYQSGASQFPVSLSGTYRETPTVTYTPVSGRAFAVRMLSPLRLYQIFLMSRSGWDLRRLLLACVEEINGLENVSTSVGFAPKPRPATLSDFERVAVLMENLEVADALETVIIDTQRQPTKKGGSSMSSTLSSLRFELLFRDDVDDPVIIEKAGELKRLLHLDPARNRFPIVAALEEFDWQREALVVQARSLLSVMLYLAGSIDIPGDESPAGLAGGDATGGVSSIFQVYVTDSRPDGAAVSVRWGDRWYWIAADDRNTKTTFALLGYLLRLQRAREGSTSPGVLLTIPTN